MTLGSGGEATAWPARTYGQGPTPARQSADSRGSSRGWTAWCVIVMISAGGPPVEPGVGRREGRGPGPRLRRPTPGRFASVLRRRFGLPVATRNRHAIVAVPEVLVRGSDFRGSSPATHRD